jgi:hypothetical protein
MCATQNAMSSANNLGVRQCSNCARPAVLSLACLLSTIGASPRRQKCGEAVSLCAACVHSLVQILEVSPLPIISKALCGAYTVIAGHSADVTELNPASLEADEAR